MTSAADQRFAEALRLEEQGDLPRALASFRRAVELDDTDPRYWISLGVCLSKLRHWSEAAKALTRGIDLKPHDAEADARLLLAEALAGGGELNRAREQYRMDASMEPSYPSYDKPMLAAKKRLAEMER